MLLISIEPEHFSARFLLIMTSMQVTYMHKIFKFQCILKYELTLPQHWPGMASGMFYTTMPHVTVTVQ